MATKKTAKKRAKKEPALYAFYNEDNGAVEIYKGKPKIEREVRYTLIGNCITDLCSEAASSLKLKPNTLVKLDVGVVPVEDIE